MQRTIFFLTLSSSVLFAQLDLKQQAEAKQQAETRQLAIQGGSAVGAFAGSAHPVLGAPYSATVVNESVQTLADGNRIVQKSTGTTARDSEGRTRNDAALPMIGNMSPTGAPHLVFIVDPVAQTSYTLNLDEKTAHGMLGKIVTDQTPGGPDVAAAKWFARTSALPATLSTMPPPPPPIGGPMGPVTVSISGQKLDLDKEQAESRTEDLGIQVIEGVNAQGVRSTRTITTGEIGNEKPIEIVTEVWTSPDLKTIVMSKRTDPRSGEQTFRLTNITRSEPDPALFTVPADFKTVEAGKDKIFFYQSKE
ncbi:MAG: hypothetical protein ABSE86_16615 [Bryobacteraceae bacterium]|jgi:hypothetical protein